jgi:hypothetical protein
MKASDIENYVQHGGIEEKEYRLYDKSSENDNNDSNTFIVPSKIYGGTTESVDPNRFAEFGTPIFIAVRATIPKQSIRFSTSKQSALLSDELFDELFKRVQPIIQSNKNQTLNRKQRKSTSSTQKRRK